MLEYTETRKRGTREQILANAKRLLQNEEIRLLQEKVAGSRRGGDLGRRLAECAEIQREDVAYRERQLDRVLKREGVDL